MTLPVVKSELIHTLGEQMRDRSYLEKIEKEMYEENKDLAIVCDNSMLVIDDIVDILTVDKDNIDPATLVLIQKIFIAATTVGRATYLMMYQALKQQDICNELDS